MDKNELKHLMKLAYLQGVADTTIESNGESIGNDSSNVNLAFGIKASVRIDTMLGVRYRYEIKTEDMTILSHKTYSSHNVAQTAAIKACEQCEIGNKTINIIEI